MSSLTNKGGIYEDVIKGFEEKFKTLSWNFLLVRLMKGTLLS